MKIRCVFLGLLLAVTSISLCSCTHSTGYRDQAYYSLERGGEAVGGGRYGSMSAASVRLAEFLSAYRFDLPAMNGAPLTGRLVIGGSGTEREKNCGYLMLAVTAPEIPENMIPPRYWAIALDASYSMQDGDRWKLATAAASRLIARLRPRDRVSLLTFGEEVKLHAEWGPPSAASRALSTVRAKPEFSRDDHNAGLAKLASLLWEAESSGHGPSGFYISEMEGAPTNISVGMCYARDMGADINVIGIAGGNEYILREFARASSGSYVFIADEGALERNFGSRLSEIFDCAARDVRVSIRHAENRPIFPAGDTDYDRNRYAYGAPQWTSLDIGRMGPGETSVHLWRIEGIKEGAPLDLTARIRGYGPSEEKFLITLNPSVGFITPGGETKEGRALLKAITIAREVQIISETLSGGYCYGRRSLRDVMARIKRVTDEVRRAQEALGDPEFARDLEALEAVAAITEEDIERYRRERQRGGSLKWWVLFPVKLAGVPLFLVGALLIGLD